MAHTAKTSKVLDLFEKNDAPPVATNPLIKPPDKENVQPVFIKAENGTQFVNIPFILINEQVGSIMERFHCCTCEQCVTAVTEECLRKLPPEVVRIKRKSDADTINRAVADARSDAIRIITKAVMFVKSNPKH